MTEIENAKRQVDAANARLMKLKEERHEREVAPKLAAMVGQHWVYRRNCYSCSEKPSDYWDMYARVDEVEGCTIMLTVAQVDSYGAPSLSRMSAVSWDGELPAKWERTTKRLFDEEVRRVKKLLRIV